jgi:hypothetical protein
MKLIPAVIIALMAIPAAHAQVAGSIDCLAGVTPAPPTFSLLSTVGVVSDYTLFCTNTGFVRGSVGQETFDFFMNVPEINTGTWTLTEGANSYNGIFGPSNTVEFQNVAYDTNQASYSFELHGVEVNPSLWPAGFEYQEFLSVAGGVTLPIPNPTQTVAFNADAPEPSTLWLAAVALGGVLLRRRANGASRC